MIQTGHSFPIADRIRLLHGGGLLAKIQLIIKDAVSEFEMLPRVKSDGVTLEIHPYQANLGSQRAERGPH